MCVRKSYFNVSFYCCLGEHNITNSMICQVSQDTKDTGTQHKHVKNAVHIDTPPIRPFHRSE